MKSSLLIVYVILTANLIAQTTIAVIDFEGKGVTNVEASALTDRLRTELFNIGGYKVVERGMMEEILGELGYQQSGCTSDECIVEVGKHLGVEQMVGGSISKVGRTYSVSARIVSVETREIIKTATYDYRGEIDGLLTFGMRNVALKLLENKAKPESTYRMYQQEEPNEIDVAPYLVKKPKLKNGFHFGFGSGRGGFSFLQLWREKQLAEHFLIFGYVGLGTPYIGAGVSLEQNYKGYPGDGLALSVSSGYNPVGPVPIIVTLTFRVETGGTLNKSSLYKRLGIGGEFGAVWHSDINGDGSLKHIVLPVASIFFRF